MQCMALPAPMPGVRWPSAPMALTTPLPIGWPGNRSDTNIKNCKHLTKVPWGTVSCVEPCQTAATNSLDLDIFSNIGSPPVFPLFQCCLWKNEANNEIEVKRCSSHTISVGAGLKINKRCIFTFLFRLKLPNILNTTSRFLGQGTSSSLVYIIWAVFGGFLMHIILSNYLTVLLKPEFETPVDTTKDLLKSYMATQYSKMTGFGK